MSSTVGYLSHIKFVKERGETTDPVMLQAAQMLEEKGVTAQWVWSEDVENDKDTIFVLEKFETEIYHFLLRKTKIIGPLAIIAHLTNNWPLPLDREKPVHNMTLFGVTVCVTQTGADPEKRARILELASFMGSRTRNDFTRRVTHLVAGQVGSSKYKAARSQRVPVLRVSWIDYCWERGQKELICGTDANILANHKCPPLTGCTISSTGYNVEERNTLEQLVNQNGGQYSRQLTKESCTHLIVGSVTSQKYQCAQQWKIHCITPQWLYKSIETGYWQDETDYPVGGGGKGSGGEKKRVSSDQLSDNKGEGGTLLKKRSVSSDSSSELLIKKKKPLQVEDEFDEETLLSQYQNAELPPTSPPPLPTGVNGFFTGIKVSISEVLSDHGNTTISKHIKKNGGSIVSPDMSCDYHITSLSCPPFLPPQATNIVTIIWLEHCLISETIIDHTSHFLFRPLPVTINDLVLRGCVLTIRYLCSQFAGLEREHLICLGKSLGAIVQDYFSHYSNGDLLASTHLILKEPRGDKYTSALSWGIPAVTQDWLFECAKSQVIVSTDDYLVRETTPSPPNNGCVSMGGASMREDSIIKTPLKSFCPNFDVESALHELPHQPSESPHYDTQLANQFEVNMAQALKTVSDAENEVENRRDCLKGVVVFIHKKLASKQGELYPLVKSMGGTIRRSYTRDCTHLIYQGKEVDSNRDKQLVTARNNGCFIVSHHWLLACSKSGYKEEETFYPFYYNPNKSLNILSQKIAISPPLPSTEAKGKNHHQHNLTLNENEREEEREESEGKEREKKERADKETEGEDPMEVEEGTYESTLEREDDNSKSSHLLQQQIQAIMENNGLNQGTSGVNSRRLMRKPMLGPSSTNKDASRLKKPVRRFNKLRDSPPADHLLTESQLMTVTYQDIDKQHEAELLDIIKQPHYCPETMADDPSPKPPPVGTGGINDHTPRLPPVGVANNHIPKLGVANDHTPRLPPLKRGVSDPSLKLSSVEGTNHNSKVHVPSIDTKELSVQEIEAPPTPVPPPLHLPIVTTNKTPNNPLLVNERRSTLRSSKVVLPLKIQLSSLSAQEKADYGALIQELGGLYLESDRFISDCSHLIVGRSSRAEKFLAACATGKWILQKSFMEASRSEGQFVNEEDHEWSSLCQPPGKSSSLDDAPKKWRLKLLTQPNKGGAFIGWKVLLCVEPFKHNGLKRLLEAGGATVTAPTQATTSLPSLTHAFIHLPSLTKDLTLETLVQYNVPCLRPDYIAEYIQTGTPIDTNSFTLPEALKLIQLTNEK